MVGPRLAPSYAALVLQVLESGGEQGRQAEAGFASVLRSQMPCVAGECVALCNLLELRKDGHGRFFVGVGGGDAVAVSTLAKDIAKSSPQDIVRLHGSEMGGIVGRTSYASGFPNLADEHQRARHALRR